MTAYAVAKIESWDDVRYKEYGVLAIPTVDRYGGRFLNGRMGCRREVLEGPDSVPKRLVILEFDSYDRAKEWWDSEEDQQARARRSG